MITRSKLAEQLREYQIRSKHDWASVSFFSSTSNLAYSRVDTAIFVIWELVILAFYKASKTRSEEAAKDASPIIYVNLNKLRKPLPNASQLSNLREFLAHCFWGHLCFRQLFYLLWLEEMDRNSLCHYRPYCSEDEQNTQSHPESAKCPIEPPHRARLFGFLDPNPHQAGVR